MMISAFSSSLRNRAAQEAPPATPPTMMTFMINLLSQSEGAEAALGDEFRDTLHFNNSHDPARDGSAPSCFPRKTNPSYWIPAIALFWSTRTTTRRLSASE